MTKKLRYIKDKYVLQSQTGEFYFVSPNDRANPVYDGAESELNYKIIRASDKNKEECLIKIIPKSGISESEARKSISKMIELQQFKDIPYAAAIRDYGVDSDNYYLITPSIDFTLGTIKNYISGGKRFEEAEVFNGIKQIIAGVLVLKKLGIYLKELSYCDVLVLHQRSALPAFKYCFLIYDFWHHQYTEEEESKTLFFESGIIYSIGLLCLYMLTGKECESNLVEVKSIQDVIPNISITPATQVLLEECIIKSEHTKISIEELLEKVETVDKSIVGADSITYKLNQSAKLYDLTLNSKLLDLSPKSNGTLTNTEMDFISDLNKREEQIIQKEKEFAAKQLEWEDKLNLRKASLDKMEMELLQLKKSEEQRSSELNLKAKSLEIKEMQCDIKLNELKTLEEHIGRKESMLTSKIADIEFRENSLNQSKIIFRNRFSSLSDQELQIQYKASEISVKESTLNQFLDKINHNQTLQDVIKFNESLTIKENQLKEKEKELANMQVMQQKEIEKAKEELKKEAVLKIDTGKLRKESSARNRSNRLSNGLCKSPNSSLPTQKSKPPVTKSNDFGNRKSEINNSKKIAASKITTDNNASKSLPNKAKISIRNNLSLLVVYSFDEEQNKANPSIVSCKRRNSWPALHECACKRIKHSKMISANCIIESSAPKSKHNWALKSVDKSKPKISSIVPSSYINLQSLKCNKKEAKGKINSKRNNDPRSNNSMVYSHSPSNFSQVCIKYRSQHEGSKLAENDPLNIKFENIVDANLCDIPEELRPMAHYIGVPLDNVDKQLEKELEKVFQVHACVPIQFKRLSYGQYAFGKMKIKMSIANGVISVRHNSQNYSLIKFLATSIPTECQRIKTTSVYIDYMKTKKASSKIRTSQVCISPISKKKQ